MTLDEQLDEIVAKIPSVNPSRHYWLIRTQSGVYYENFVENNYIAIDPSNITLSVIQDLEKKAAGNLVQLSNLIRDFIKESYFQIHQKKINNRTAGRNTNQIYKFLHEVKEGDIVLIPSMNSNYVSIGEIVENRLAEFNEQELDKISCPYQLRRKVKWLDTIPRHKLDANLYMLFVTHQAISQINKYANTIERSINDFYVLFETAHVILNVETNRNIPAKDLFGFGTLLLNMLDEYATFNNLDISSNDIELEINLNSPGKVDFKSRIKKTTFVLGLLTFIGGGGYKSPIFEFKTDGLPGLIRSVEEYLDHSQKRSLEEKLFNKYYDNLKVKNPEEFNKLINKLSENKDLPKDEIDTSAEKKRNPVVSRFMNQPPKKLKK